MQAKAIEQIDEQFEQVKQYQVGCAKLDVNGNPV
jgi:hypothetical protein